MLYDGSLQVSRQTRSWPPSDGHQLNTHLAVAQRHAASGVGRGQLPGRVHHDDVKLQTEHTHT